MKQLLFCTMLCTLISYGVIAQPKKATDNKKAPATVGEHVGTWRLLSQKVTSASGQIFMGDSSNTFQHKILTPTTFVVVIEKKIPALDNKKLVTSVAGGRYTFVNGNYEELTQYASFKGFETMKVNYRLMIEDGKLHTVGTVGDAVYDEVYVRED